MFRVMIADDEKIVIDSLKYIIEKNFNDVEIISTARSGREAIEKAEYSVPDIVFMDIKMPGINGIDAIREIKKLHKQVIFIVLTAFDQFEFAKEAIHLGVIEYLLKPVNRTKVVEVINKAIDIVRDEKEKRNTELELKEKLERVLPVLENGFIYSMILFDDNEKEFLNYREIFGIEENSGCVMAVELGEVGNCEEPENRIGHSIRSNRLYPLLRDTVSTLGRCIVGPLMLNRVILFVPVECKSDEGLNRQVAFDFAKTLIKRFSGKVKCSLKIGIGRYYESVQMMSSSYDEALKALRCLNNPGIMHFDDIQSTTSSGTGYPQQIEKLLIQKVAVGDAAESVDILNYIFNWLLSEHGEQHLKIKNKLLELLFLVNRLAGEYDCELEDNGVDFLEDMLSIDDMVELRLWCRKVVEDAVGKINLYRNYKTGELIKKAKEYIKTNFSKSITLEDISSEINVSPQYLSKLFKEETGENFIDYLTGIRINIAKGLLENSGSSIKEVCYNTGYSDPNYFSRIFKKIVGVTPTEYKEYYMGFKPELRGG